MRPQIKITASTVDHAFWSEPEVRFVDFFSKITLNSGNCSVVKKDAMGYASLHLRSHNKIIAKFYEKRIDICFKFFLVLINQNFYVNE